MKLVTTSLFALSCVVLGGCASTAADVKVPTMSMQQAWAQSGTPAGDSAQKASGRMVNSVIRQDQPLPVVSAPDIRMAYIYQAQDQEGNMHYGSWVAIPVDSFKWLMPEGAALPMDGGRAPNVPSRGF